MEFQKQPSKFIKPLVPTPSNLKHYKLGFIDELAAIMNVHIVLFFTKNHYQDPNFVVQLEKSLAKTLARLYPLAGRYVEESQIVECNDEGVEFIQAKVNIKLEDILGLELDVRPIDEFIPLRKKPQDILAIQVTTFECGGVALGVNATHKVFDGSTLSTFLNTWAAMNREENINEIMFTTPGFISSSLFPGRGCRPMPLQLVTDDDTLSKYTNKRLTFSESVISDLRAKAIKSGKVGTRHLSKLQLVSAAIWKALINVDHATYGYPRESILFQPMNLRERMGSSIHKHACGNIWAVCATKPTILEKAEELANLINDSVTKAANDYSKVHHDSEEGQTMVLDSFLNLTNIPKSTNVIAVTSWCKFPFYDADFGFGRPIWAGPGTVPVKNSVLFIDDKKGNGVEAFIFLEVKDVPYFEEALDVSVFAA